MGGIPFQSKLEPYRDFIRECRRKRWSYARIAEAIREQFGIRVSSNTVFSFVKVRSKPLHMYELHSPKPLSSETQPADGFFEPSSAQPQKSHEIKPLRYNLDF